VCEAETRGPEAERLVLYCPPVPVVVACMLCLDPAVAVVLTVVVVIAVAVVIVGRSHTQLWHMQQGRES